MVHTAVGGHRDLMDDQCRTLIMKQGREVTKDMAGMTETTGMTDTTTSDQMLKKEGNRIFKVY